MYQQNQTNISPILGQKSSVHAHESESHAFYFPEKEKYIRDWTALKRARFNAAKRYERKHDASTFAFVVSGVFGFLVPFYALLFRDVLALQTQNLLEFTAYAIGGLSLILGLVEQARGYTDKQRKFHECGLGINKILRHLRGAPITRTEELLPYIREYERIIDRCGDNHDDIDTQIAFTQGQWDKADERNRDALEKKLKRLKRHETYTIYQIYIILWGTPLIVSILTLLFVKSS